jgi:hypothetical protein
MPQAVLQRGFMRPICALSVHTTEIHARIRWCLHACKLATTTKLFTDEQRSEEPVTAQACKADHANICQPAAVPRDLKFPVARPHLG